MRKNFGILVCSFIVFIIMASVTHAIDARTYFYQGTKYLGQGKLHQAVEALSKAISLDPQYGYAYVNRGLAYFELNDLRKARADFLEAIAIDPSNEIAKNNLGILYYNSADYEQALKYFESALSSTSFQSPYRAAIYRNLSLVYKRLGDMDKAKQVEARAAQIQNTCMDNSLSDSASNREHLWATRQLKADSEDYGLVLRIYKQE